MRQLTTVPRSFTFQLISDAFNAVRDADDFYGINGERVFFEITLRTGLVGGLFERFATIVLIITVVELGNGFMYALTHKPATYRKILFFASLGAGVLLFAISVAYFGKLNAAYTPYINYFYGDDREFDSDAFEASLNIVRKLGATFDILAWIISMPLIAYGAVAVHFHKGNPFLRNVSRSTVPIGVASLPANPSPVGWPPSHCHDIELHPTALLRYLRRHVHPAGGTRGPASDLLPDY